MFWDDIREIKQTLNSIRLSMEYEMSRPNINHSKTRKLEGVITEEYEDEPTKFEHIESQLDQIKESIEDRCNNDDLSNSYDSLHDKLNTLLNDEKRLEETRVVGATLDKFDDYMKNVDKLNMMVNEFKGLVSVATACLSEKKEFETLLDDIRVVAKNIRFNSEMTAKMSNESAKLDTQQFQIQAMYKVLVEDKLKDKEPPKKRRAKVKPV